MDTWMVLVAWILFGGSHILLATGPVRNKLGEKPHQGIFALVALATLAFLITTFVLTKSMGTPFLAAGDEHIATEVICDILMILAFILMVGGFANKTPVAMGDSEIVANGIVRITRHPMNMAFALFGLAHILTNRYPGDWFFYGGFVLFGYFGAFHQDKKKITQRGEAMATFVSQTSIIPFAAMITGKQKLSFKELPKIPILVAIVVAVVARILHPGSGIW